MTKTCSLANPAIISLGVIIPNRVRNTTPVTKVNAGPIISSYKEIRMKIMTNMTSMESKESIKR